MGTNERQDGGAQDERKVVLITGASSGMGKAFALELLRRGYRVYGAARRTDAMRELVEVGGHALAMDVTDDDAIRAGVDRILQEQGRIDVLINNAGYAVYGSVEETDLADARRQFDVNLFGLASLTRLIIPRMRDQGRGRIINISSMGGRIYTPLGAWYHASKHALEGWSDCLRLELAAFGIDVVVIQPGIIRTGFIDVMMAPMIARSGSGPYGALARKVAKGGEGGVMGFQGSDPTVVARTVARAVAARRPRTRYAVGFLARPLMFLRRWGGDRIFDRGVMSAA